MFLVSFSFWCRIEAERFLGALDLILCVFGLVKAEPVSKTRQQSPSAEPVHAKDDRDLFLIQGARISGPSRYGVIFAASFEVSNLCRAELLA